jgi:hypothetical protein
MAKKGIDHHLCREHGADGLTISEMPPNTAHRFKVECRLCNRWIAWCSEDQAEEFARRFGPRIKWSFRAQQATNLKAPTLPTLRDAQRWAEMQKSAEFMQTLKERHEEHMKATGKRPKRWRPK